MLTAAQVYHGSDAALTRRYYAQLTASSPQGIIAKHLMQTSKASARAKVYRGGPDGRSGPRYRDLAYEKKQWAMGELCRVLDADGSYLWGWGRDASQPMFSHVLYVELEVIGILPPAQVSFHTNQRLSGPEYRPGWDGTHQSAERILAFCDAVLGQAMRLQGVLNL